MAAIDVTDATFETEVLERSASVPVVVDLWAPWCGPCRTLGPILERVIDGTGGGAVLAKVNVDENPRVGATFRVQSIPAVFAIRDRQVVDHFIGALPEPAVRAFVEGLVPTASPADKLVAIGTEDALRAALDLEADHAGAITALAELLVERGDADAKEEALSLLARIPESADTRRIAALARVEGAATVSSADDIEHELDALLERVKADEEARQRYLDLLEVLGPEDPRTLRYRRALTARLF